LSESARVAGLVALGIALTITALSLGPVIERDKVVTFQDKIEHLVAYAGLAAAVGRWLWLLRGRPAAGVWRVGAVALVAATAWGGAVEVMQGALTDRVMSVWDGIANGVGAALGVAIWLAWTRARSGRCGAPPAGFAAGASAALLSLLVLLPGAGCSQAHDASRGIAGRPPEHAGPDAWARHLVAIAADRPRLERDALAALARWPGEALFHHAAALGALDRGDRPVALRRARLAARLDPGLGGAVRLARRLLVEQDRPREAFELWAATLPPAHVFGGRGGGAESVADRHEALRRAVAQVERAPHDEGARLALARAMSACGWLEEAAAQAARLRRIDAHVERRVRLGRAMRKAVTLLGPDSTMERALRLVAAAAESAGLPPAMQGLSHLGGEAGSHVTPDAPLVRRLLEAGLVIELRETGRGLLARLDVLLARFDVPAGGDGEAAVCALVEGGDVGLGGRSPLLGRTSPVSLRVMLDLDALRPWPADVARGAELLAGAAPRGARDVALSRVLRAALPGRRSAAPAAIREALLEARLAYVAAHEVGHVLDLRRLGAPGGNALASLGRALEGGLQPAVIRARYEEVAELYAIARGDADAPAAALLSLITTAEGAAPGGVERLAADAVLDHLATGADEGGLAAVARIPTHRLRELAATRLLVLGVPASDSAP
jgi:VanZ family protein